MVVPLSSRIKSERMVELKFAQSELNSLTSLQQSVQHQKELQLLSEATGVEDPLLLERLHAAGFHAGNVFALTWLPIALAAWASDGVSKDEADASKLVNLCAVLTGNTESKELFRTWLVHKPNERLTRLWEDYVSRHVATLDDIDRQQTGEAIFYIARKVAEASGGLFGVGQISPAEQRVLDRIRAVYGLS